MISPKMKGLNRCCGLLRLELCLLCVLFSSLVGLSVATYDVCTDDESGAYLACQPNMFDIVWYETFKVTVTPENSTCGTPPSTYKRLGDRSGTVSICNASSPSLQHPPAFIIDTNSTTWWQSVNQRPNTKDLRINITLSFNKTFIMGGDIIITFNSGRPEQMVLEKSTDYGLTWRPLQFYARNCTNFKSELVPGATVTADNPTAVVCTNRSVETVSRPPVGQKLAFPVDDRFELFLGPNEVDFVSLYTALDNKMLDFLKFTDLRIRLIQPVTDGQVNYDSYYYGIADFQSAAWCDCNLHAAYCNYTDTDVICDCRHNTMGKECDSCLPLYQERPWKRGSFLPYDSGTANECIKCECNDHALSCVYNVTYGRGICQECLHNTRGYHCELCSLTYYPNVSLPLNDISWCIECDCDLMGVFNNSLVCAQTNTSTEIIGQCLCRPLITGRRCDQCIPGYYGLKDGPTPGNCTACRCNLDGTVGQSDWCRESGGQCPCKNNTKGRECGTCADGYFSFPTGNPQRDCLTCDCDKGGSKNTTCDKGSGQCSCRTNITGEKCNLATAGTFVPMIDTLTYEPQSGCALTSDLYTSENPFDGAGFAVCNISSQNVSVSLGFIRGAMIQKDLQWPYVVAVRYSGNSSGITGTLTVQVTGNTQEDLSVLSTRLGQNVSRVCPVSVGSSDLVVLTFPAAGLSTASLSRSDNITLDVRCVYSLTLELHQNVDLGATGNNTANVTGPSSRKKRAVFSDSASSITIDSILLLPGLSRADGSVAFQVYTKADNQTVIQDSYLSCLQQVAALSSRQRTLGQSPCKELLFSLGAELYDGARECACSPAGTDATSLLPCQSLGGQCQCRPGVSGRTCDTCTPGFFNFTSNGCTPCNCHPHGAKNGACNITTGQCLCHPNITLISNAQSFPTNTSGSVDIVRDGTCSVCLPSFYGINSGVGCVQCECNQQGSSGQQCNETGQCPCKDSVTGQKCDVCREGFFGFASTGCSACNCSDSGSTSANCNQTTGGCTCKTNALGPKCSDCKNGFFNLASYNPDGCQPCFCYGHGRSCNSSDGFRATLLQMSNPASIVQSGPLLGDHHISYGLNVTLGLSAGYVFDLYNETLISFTGNGKSIYHKARNGTFIVPGTTLLYVVQLLERNWGLQDELGVPTAFDVMGILANMTEISLISRSRGQAINVTYLGLQSAEKMATSSSAGVQSGIADVTVTYVEQCTCNASDHVDGLSCERCATGHMRNNVTDSSSYDLCIPCDCRGRGATNPPECEEQTGLCLNCRNGTIGDHCERCAAFVVGVECNNCSVTYWGLQADGCRACNCSSPGSVGQECDPYSGQCRCASHVDGRTCDQCEENFQGISSAGCVECDACYSLMKTEIVPLRELRGNITSRATLLENRDVTSTLGSFISRLKLAVLETEQLITFLTSMEQSSSEINSKIMAFNKTLDLVLDQISDIGNTTLTIEQNLTTADALVKLALSHRVTMETRVKTVYTGIASLQASGLVLRELTRSLQTVESHLQSLANASTANQEIIGYLTSLNQTVSRVQQLINELSQKSQDASKVHQSSSGTLLMLESMVVSLMSRVSRTSASARSLAARNVENKATVKRLQDILAGLITYVIDYVTMASRTINALSLTSSFQSQVVAETSLFTPSNLKALQSESLLEPFINGTHTLNSKASTLLWKSSDVQQRSSIIQKEAKLLFESAQSILATATNFSAHAAEVQQRANNSLNQVVSLSKQSQELINQSDNLTEALVFLKQNVSAAKETSQQALLIIQEKHQKLLSLSDQAEKLQSRLATVTDVSKERYTALNNTRFNIVTPAQKQCLGVNVSVSEFRDKLSEAEFVTNEAVQRVSNVTQRANQMLAALKNIQSVDTASTQVLLNQVLNARSNVNVENLRTVINNLQASRNIQRNEIDRLSAVRNSLRDRVQSLKSLQGQITNV